MEYLSTPFDLSPPDFYGFPFTPITRLACDRFQGLFAVALNPNLIKVWSLSGLERTLTVATKGLVTHIQFLQNHGLLAAAVLSGNTSSIHVWVINTGQPVGDPIVLPENDPVTSMHIPDLELVPATCSDSSDLIYLGTDSGVIYVLSIAERSLRKFAPLNWKSIFPHAQKLCSTNPVTAIRVHKRKPYRILVSFKFTGAVIYNLKKRKQTQVVNTTRTEILDAIWAYEMKAMGLAYSSGDIVFFNTKGKLRAPLVVISVAPEPVTGMYWVKYEATPPLLIALTQSGKVCAYFLGKSVIRRVVGFSNGCKALFAGDIYSSYSETSNGQSKNIGKTIYFRVLAGVSKAQNFSVYNLDHSLLWDQKAAVLDRPLLTCALPCDANWTIPKSVQYVSMGEIGTEFTKKLFMDTKENIKKVALNEDSLLSYLKMFYQNIKKSYETPLMSGYELVDSVLNEVEKARAKSDGSLNQGLLFINDISGHLGIYELTAGSLRKICKFSERIHTFDFDSKNQLLAIGTDRKAILLSSSVSCEMYSYESMSSIRQVMIVHGPSQTSALIIATTDGNIVVANPSDKTHSIINTGINPPDTISSIYACPCKTEIEIMFATKQGMIGWCSTSGRVDSVRPVRPSILGLKESETAVKKLWSLKDPPLIVCVQGNTICLCERDQHNCLCVYKSLVAKGEIQAVELINKDQHLAYSVQQSSLISVVATANLEAVTSIETSIPSIYAMKWTDESLVVIGHNAVAVYETYYKGGKKDYTVEMFDVKKLSRLTMAAAKKYGASESIKAILDKVLGKGTIKA